MPPDRFSIPPQIMDEASGWFVLMREPSVLVEDQEAFAQWLRASPVHVGAYLEIARLWGDAAHLGPDINLAAGQALQHPAVDGPRCAALPRSGAQRAAGRAKASHPYAHGGRLRLLCLGLRHVVVSRLGFRHLHLGCRRAACDHVGRWLDRETGLPLEPESAVYSRGEADRAFGRAGVV